MNRLTFAILVCLAVLTAVLSAIQAQESSFEFKGGKWKPASAPAPSTPAGDLELIRKMVADGIIHDAKTISTLALYWLKKGTI